MVLAVDPDRSALARGRAEAKRRGLRNVTFSEGAAQRLRIADGSFDVVIFSWTL
jgi:ubiquinone/menaquinone biosynthesis C-methylase UbiE